MDKPPFETGNPQAGQGQMGQGPQQGSGSLPPWAEQAAMYGQGQMGGQGGYGPGQGQGAQGYGQAQGGHQGGYSRGGYGDGAQGGCGGHAAYYGQAAQGGYAPAYAAQHGSHHHQHPAYAQQPPYPFPQGGYGPAYGFDPVTGAPLYGPGYAPGMGMNAGMNMGAGAPPQVPAQSFYESMLSMQGISLQNPVFVKGLLLGAGATLLFTNDSVQRSLIGSLVRVWSTLQGGVEELKERFRDAEAEAAAHGDTTEAKA